MIFLAFWLHFGTFWPPKTAQSVQKSVKSVFFFITQKATKKNDFRIEKPYQKRSVLRNARGPGEDIGGG